MTRLSLASFGHRQRAVGVSTTLQSLLNTQIHTKRSLTGWDKFQLRSVEDFDTGTALDGGGELSTKIRRVSGVRLRGSSGS